MVREQEVCSCPLDLHGGERPEDDTVAVRLVIDLDLGLLPKDPGAEVRRTLGFWAAWLPKMDLTRPAEHELRDSNHRVVGKLRLIGASATDEPEALR